MNTDSDSKHCIVHAADTLYEQGGRARFPTVDAVRRQAHVSMNDANTVMKQWRRTHLSGRQTEPGQLSPWTKRASHSPPSMPMNSLPSWTRWRAMWRAHVRADAHRPAPDAAD